MQTKNNQTAIAKNLFDLLNQKVKKVNKKSTLQKLDAKDLKTIEHLEVMLGVYAVENIVIYKIFISADILIKGAYKQYNIISNALLNKNKDKKEKIAPKINIYNNQDNGKFYNTVIQFVKNKLNENDDLKPGEYILTGFKLGDLLEVEI